jgi:molybdenum cofactor cytidylyltransferase
MIVGVLLAAGQGSRFGSNKLVHRLGDGTPLAVAALRNLAQSVDDVVAVVRPDDADLIDLLTAEGARIVPCFAAAHGMGASLACGVHASDQADGWLIALADMPYVPPAVVRQLADRLRAGAAIVAPEHDGQRGHPVGFRRAFLAQLSDLSGDRGARDLIQSNAHRLELIPSADPGVLWDIDALQDLERSTADRL